MWDAMWVNLVTAQVEAQDEAARGILDILLDTSGVVLGVLILLTLLSLISWYIIAYKWFYLYRARRESMKFLDIFWQSKRLDSIYQSAQDLGRSPVSQVFQAGYIELSKLKSSEGADGSQSAMSAQLSGIENVERALRRAKTSEVTNLESKLTFLATVGSNAPFIGLFGTVWGIMIAFVNISAKNAAGIDVVAGPIAEALIVTAFGLVTAIPAGAAYNYFLNRINVLGSEMDNFSDDFLNIVKRHFFK